MRSCRRPSATTSLTTSPAGISSTWPRSRNSAVNPAMNRWMGRAEREAGLASGAPAMTVERIYTSPTPGGRQLEQESIRVVAGSGIEGDRYFGRHDEPGQNLTLIEIEEVEAFVREQGRGN